ncbi:MULTISPECIES: hypothetical protein [unclassified Nocardiopsis]|uniref:hypothetical protein n=1 Tax=unclassified Nocardiopsis TaxID=2649073 RepID=UPI001357D2FD|nr:MULTISPECIES: hypothetical protein [unclassified Nocardiopsis]
MRNPIPSPRRPDDVRRIRPFSRRTPLVGPACPVCEHPSCRESRAQCLPRLGGHRAEFAVEHASAAEVQARHHHLIVYFGEATQSFWAITPAGMVEARDVDALLLALWPHTDPPAARPWAGPTAGRVPVAA